MNERRKLINWMAGVTTFIVVLLIVIVLLDREEDGVSLAAASRTVALTLESGNGILENGLYSILFISTVHICFSIVEVSKAMTKSAVLLRN